MPVISQVFRRRTSISGPNSNELFGRPKNVLDTPLNRSALRRAHTNTSAGRVVRILHRTLAAFTAPQPPLLPYHRITEYFASNFGIKVKKTLQ
ncbi:hypothetical protein MVEN_02355400 [Mycena venus]|uniref:Uncharacterized protein n=1 Tax=Mycena venus TaxID=2733690 RepID=A0A8H6X3A8_9AGAR|nr:hypothetical protein MVEN_02355400 [Mycena venus]